MNVISLSAPKTGSHMLGFGLGVGTKPIYYRSSTNAFGEVLDEDGMIDRLVKWRPSGIWCHIPYTLKMERFVLSKYEAALFIRRDPRDVVVSHSHYIDKYVRGGDRVSAINYPCGIEGMKLGGWEHSDRMCLLILILSRQLRAYTGWLSNREVYQVRYEDMIADREGEFRKIREWLLEKGVRGVPMLREMVTASARKHRLSFRKGEVGDWKNEFDDVHYELASRFLLPVMKEWGYSWTG